MSIIFSVKGQLCSFDGGRLKKRIGLKKPSSFLEEETSF